MEKRIKRIRRIRRKKRIRRVWKWSGVHWKKKWYRLAERVFEWRKRGCMRNFVSEDWKAES